MKLRVAHGPNAMLEVEGDTEFVCSTYQRFRDLLEMLRVVPVRIQSLEQREAIIALREAAVRSQSRTLKNEVLAAYGRGYSACHKRWQRRKSEGQ